MQCVKFNFAMYFEFVNARYEFRIYHVFWIFLPRILNLSIQGSYTGNLSIPVSLNPVKNFQ